MLLEIVDRVGWHSEDQYLQMRHLVRTSEDHLKEDGAVPVVPPGPANAAPTPANPNEVLAAAGVAFDYDKLAQAMVRAQAKIAAEQNTAAAEAVAAAPGWEPPGAVTATAIPVGLGAQVAAADPNAAPA